eukprot:Gregarina_sp_Poly_1__5610@NODE_295_length_9857_cov_104_674974_g255_i0_p3_GENE_NODE_295_length_9857_cov_104_674974_g255_i0NODE_295_length_9857_cov_104_674974_g255_i0_p3_ORF_typecomplete_len304_score69_97PUB/PF09409_10/2e17UBA/PF00627_31/0_015UBA/PF00627_31/6_2e03SMC_N/PF02463_19/0_021Borrelia_P83/PF05262_11/0_16AspBHydro_N/PF05279_11/0_24Atg14/PF10186_9/1_1Coilin_N/PF15862_5/1_4AAA_23/PF13476_6/4DUF572/PF04502_13/4_6_NODE_295_length_9857_cov_104_674974_g255_i012692180
MNEPPPSPSTNSPPDVSAQPESPKEEPKPDSGDIVINEADINFLVEAGVEYNNAALALYNTHGRGIDAALEWLSANNRQGTSTEKKLSPEERERKALELQKKLRERRIAREKEEEKLKEKQRIESTKALLEARRAFEEQEKKRTADARQREKEERRKAEERQRELLAADYRERFGQEMPIDFDEAHNKPAKEKVRIYLGRFRDMLNDADEEEKKRIISCLRTVRLYCMNAKANPTEPKYHQIRVQNQVFQERVARYPDAVKFLVNAGFLETEDKEFLRIRGLIPDGFLLGECIKFLDFVVGQN